MNAAELRVAVVGGGIGGLSLAIALQRLDIEVEVFEQSPELAEIGAAVALSAANGTRLLRSLGVEEALTTVAEVSALQFRSWDDGELIWSHPVASGIGRGAVRRTTGSTGRPFRKRSLRAWIRGSCIWAIESSTW